VCHDLHGRGHGQLRCTHGIGFPDEDWSSCGCGTGFNTSKTRPWKQCGGAAFDDGEFATEDEFQRYDARGHDHLEERTHQGGF